MKKRFIILFSILILFSLDLNLSQAENLQSRYFSNDAEAKAIANGEKTVLLPKNPSFDSGGIDWRILNGLRLAGYEPPTIECQSPGDCKWTSSSFPFGELIDSNKIKEIDRIISTSENIIYEKADKFPFYKDNSKENFIDNLPYQFGAYNLVGIFDLINSGNIKYQSYTKECLFANLYPQLPSLVNKGRTLPFLVQQWELYGFNAQLNRWNVEEWHYPEHAIPSTYLWDSVVLHEMIHELDLKFHLGDNPPMDAEYDRRIYCGPNLMNFNYDSSDSPFNFDLNKDLSDEHFISEYASSEFQGLSYRPWEDAAESMAAYILLPEYFRERIKNSAILKKKYDYIKNNIFGGVEFENPDLNGRNNFNFPGATSDFYKINNIQYFAISNINVRNEFIRGDANSDRVVDLSDAISILDYLFKEGKEPSCLDSADVNDDGFIDISDTIKVLFVLFQGDLMPEPYPEKGFDITRDQLSCINS